MAENERDEAQQTGGEEPLESVKQAAKVAAAAAAVGAAVGAAKAMAEGGRGDADDEAEPADDTETNEIEETEQRRGVARSEDGGDGDGEERQEGPEPEAVSERGEARSERTAPEPEPPVDRVGTSAEDARRLVENARRELAALLGREAESVSSLDRTHDGWRLAVEVVELRRIPESTDVLASYEVEVDDDGKFLGYRRGRRYYRSQADGGGAQ